MGFEEEVQKANFKGIVTGAIISSLGFLVAFSWRDAITETIKKFVPEGQGLLYTYFSAVFVTFLAVVLAYLIIKIQKTNIVPDSFEEKIKQKKRILKKKTRLA